MRLATYNVEWFNSLFDAQGRLQLDDRWSARHNVNRKEQAEALAQVFSALDADGILIVEAPDTREEQRTEDCLLTFSDHFKLGYDAVVTGFLNGTQQEIAFLYRSDVIAAKHQPGGGTNASAPPFDQTFSWDIDVDGQPDAHTFSKPPLEITLDIGGQEISLIGVHVKSKAPHGAKTRQDAVRISIQNRRKQLAQCVWIRRRVNDLLALGSDVIVLGDFNDGPGLDDYEKLFGRSGVEIVLGDSTDAANQLHDPHASARLNARQAWSPATARFYNRERKTFLNALLDFIMVSSGVREHCDPKWRIWHPFDDRNCYDEPGLRDALLKASDHFPVTLDFNPKAKSTEHS